MFDMKELEEIKFKEQLDALKRQVELQRIINNWRIKHA